MGVVDLEGLDRDSVEGHIEIYGDNIGAYRVGFMVLGNKSRF